MEYKPVSHSYKIYRYYKSKSKQSKTTEASRSFFTEAFLLKLFYFSCSSTAIKIFLLFKAACLFVRCRKKGRIRSKGFIKGFYSIVQEKKIGKCFWHHVSYTGFQELHLRWAWVTNALSGLSLFLKSGVIILCYLCRFSKFETMYVTSLITGLNYTSF